MIYSHTSLIRGVRVPIFFLDEFNRGKNYFAYNPTLLDRLEDISSG